MGAEHGLPEMTTNPPTAAHTAAERMRAHRRRRRDGLRCLTIELRDFEIALLIGEEAVARNDVGAIRNALYAHLDRTLVEMP
jgi:hypothetical protein